MNKELTLKNMGINHSSFFLIVSSIYQVLCVDLKKEILKMVLSAKCLLVRADS